MQQGLMQTFGATVGPRMTRFDESQGHAQACGRMVERMAAFAAFVAPASGGVFGAVVLQQGLNPGSPSLGQQVVFEKVAGMFGLASGVDFGDGKAGGDVDGQVVVDVADVLEPADEEGVLAPDAAGPGRFDVPSFGFFASRFEFGLGDDLTELDACPFFAITAAIETMPAQYTMHAVMSDGDLVAQFVGDSSSAMPGMITNIGQDAGFVIRAGLVGRTAARLSAEQRGLATRFAAGQMLSQGPTAGHAGALAKRPLAEAGGVEKFEHEYTKLLGNGTILHGDLLGCGGTCGNAPS